MSRHKIRSNRKSVRHHFMTYAVVDIAGNPLAIFDTEEDAIMSRDIHFPGRRVVAFGFDTKKTRN